MISKLFAGTDKTNYSTPGKARLTDIIYGSSIERSAA